MTDLTAETIAPRLRAAFERRDAAKLRDLLDPDVRWGGEEDTDDTCHNRAQVLAWLANLQAQGARASVEEASVRPGSVVLHLSVALPGLGANPAEVYQVFRVADGKIVEIRGYPERHEAEAFAASSG